MKLQYFAIFTDILHILLRVADAEVANKHYLTMPIAFFITYLPTYMMGN